MARSRTQNSVRNVSLGLFVMLPNTIVTFVTRTFLVKLLGLDAVSLNGLFSEVIAMMSLAELGIGMAIVYSLYKPLCDNDQTKISQLMSLYRSAYHIVAGATILIALILLPFIDKLVNNINFPVSYIRLVFLLFAINTASSYLFSYKTALLNADQKQYIVSLTTAIIRLVFSGIIIGLLYVYKNYLLFLALQIVQSITTNVVLARYVDKHYTYLNYKDKLPKTERRVVFDNIKNIFIKRLSGVITSSTDNVLISTLVSTLQVGLYSNYVLIFSAIRTLKRQITNGVAASIGNLSVNETAEKGSIVLKRLTYLFFLFSCFVCAGLMATMSNIITIWLGEEYILEEIVVYVAILNLYIEICSEPLWQYLEVSGLFRQDKYIGILGSTINLIVSIILGKMIGMVGIFIGTVCTQVIQLILKTILLYKRKYNSSPWIYLGMWCKLFASYSVISIVQFYWIRTTVISNIYVSILVKGMMAIVSALIVSITFFIGSDEQKYSIRLIKQIIHRKIA